MNVKSVFRIFQATNKNKTFCKKILNVTKLCKFLSSNLETQTFCLKVLAQQKVSFYCKFFCKINLKIYNILISYSKHEPLIYLAKIISTVY